MTGSHPADVKGLVHVGPCFLMNGDYFILPIQLESNEWNLCQGRRKDFCLASPIVNGKAYKWLQGMLHFMDLKIGGSLAGLACSSKILTTSDADNLQSPICLR